MSDRRCVVWWARLDLLRPDHERLLDATELGRRPDYRQQADRDRFTLAAALLRLAVAAEIGGAPEAVAVRRRCATCERPHGRPSITGTDLGVSVSHSGEMVAVAVSRAGPVGVDVEAITAIDYAPMLRQVLAPGESGVRSAGDFFTYWTRKESVLKATGDGLLTSMQEVEVSAPGTAPALLRYGSVPRAAVMADLAPGDGYAGAVTVLTDGPVVFIERSAEPLLRWTAGTSR